MTSVVSRRVAELEAYVPGEQPTAPGLVKLNTNENPYPPSPRVGEAVAQAAAEELRLYPSPMADALRVRAAAAYAVDPSQILVGNGSDELLSMCLQACTTEGDAIAYPVPTYSLYRTLAAIAGVRTVELPAEPGQLPSALGRTDARVIFVCTPNSPFGTAIPSADLEALATSSRALVVADEAYVDFGADSALSSIDRCENLLVLRSFSKSFSLAGVRLGLALGSPDLIASLAKVKDSYNVSRLAIAAGVAALDDYDWMLSNVARVRATRDRVSTALRQAGYEVPDSTANFVWVACGPDGGRAVYERLRACDILVRFFDTAELRHGVRVTIGTDVEMDRFLQALA